MRISLVDSPRHIASIPKFQRIILRVISGGVVLGRDRQTLDDGGGLPVSSTDNIVQLEWDAGAVFMAASPSGSQAVVEVIVPS